MGAVSFRPFIDNYVNPVIFHPVSQRTFRIAVEVVKILAVKIFLEVVSQQLQKRGTYSAKWQFSIVHIIVTGPLIEELLFRGIILKGSHLLQIGILRFIFKYEPNDREKHILQITRVQLSALAFSAVHLTNPYSRSILIAQCISTYVDGIAYGYLHEKYQSIAPSFLFHGLNNALAIAAEFYPELGHVCVVAYCVNKIVPYIFAGLL